MLIDSDTLKYWWMQEKCNDHLGQQRLTEIIKTFPAKIIESLKEKKRVLLIICDGIKILTFAYYI